ncbi:MAG TPA: iron ABC transporter permease [Spirochaetota bacterium]|nr:iron ABC transporter permease [Spirochaetota bacterium]HQP48594.1 iron ABC transporter permease [Spirochaetota bacterium]
MKTGIKILLFTAAACGIFVLCVSAGSVFISPFRIPEILSGGAGSVEYRILVDLRIPRILMALVVGASLSVSGVVFQAVLKNPLADPYTTGVSGGAAVGATVAIAFSMSYFLVALLAFGGSLCAVSFVYAVSRYRGLSGTALVLAGIALSVLLSSAVLLVFAFSRADYVHKALLWLMGDLSIAKYAVVMRMAVVSLLLTGLGFLYRRHLNIISFGDEFAHGLGVSRGDIVNLFWIASLLAAISVSLAGVIGFVGLLVPHVMRFMFGPDHSRLIPASALGGAVFLMGADTLGRVLVPPYDIPAGIITGFAGGLFFLVLVIRKGGAYT